MAETPEAGMSQGELRGAYRRVWTDVVGQPRPCPYGSLPQHLQRQIRTPRAGQGHFITGGRSTSILSRRLCIFWVQKTYCTTNRKRCSRPACRISREAHFAPSELGQIIPGNDAGNVDGQERKTNRPQACNGGFHRRKGTLSPYQSAERPLRVTRRYPHPAARL